MFSNKARQILPEWSLSSALKGTWRLLTLITNIALSWKCLPGTNALAYLAIRMLRRKKSFANAGKGGIFTTIHFLRRVLHYSVLEMLLRGKTLLVRFICNSCKILSVVNAHPGDSILLNLLPLQQTNRLKCLSFLKVFRGGLIYVGKAPRVGHSKMLHSG
jgi:hypothetical protein